MSKDIMTKENLQNALDDKKVPVKVLNIRPTKQDDYEVIYTFDLNYEGRDYSNIDCIIEPEYDELVENIEDAVFMMKIIEKAKTAEVAGKLGYRPDLRIVSPWLDQFSLMIWKLDKDYLYGTEEKALVKQGIEAIQTVLLGKDSSAKRRLLFYLDQYLDPFYQNDLSELNEPLKALLQEVMNSDNEVDVIEEAHHLLEAYMEIE